MQQDYIALLMDARRLSDAGDRAGAEAAARRAVALMPERPTGLAILALILSEGEGLDEAAALAERVLAIAPEDAKFRNFATSVALRRGRFAEARDRALANLALDDRDQRARCDLVLADHALGGTRRSTSLLDYDAHVAIMRPAAPAGFATMAAFDDAIADAVDDAIADAVDDAIADAVGAAIDQAPSAAGTLVDGERLDNVFDLPRPLAIAMRDLITAAVDAYLRDRAPDAIAPRYRITGWANRMRAGGHELTHIHESGWISGVYYPRMPALDAAAMAGRLLFGDHHHGAVVPALPGHSILPEAGSLILFPSYLYHRTIPFAGPGERISIAFDIAAPTIRRDRQPNNGHFRGPGLCTAPCPP